MTQEKEMEKRERSESGTDLGSEQGLQSGGQMRARDG